MMIIVLIVRAGLHCKIFVDFKFNLILQVTIEIESRVARHLVEKQTPKNSRYKLCKIQAKFSEVGQL